MWLVSILDRYRLIPNYLVLVLFFNPAIIQYIPHPTIKGMIPVRINRVRLFFQGWKKRAEIIGIRIEARIPKRTKTGIEFMDNFSFDDPFFSCLNILGRIIMPIIITTRVSISVIEAKKFPNLFQCLIICFKPEINTIVKKNSCYGFCIKNS